MTGNCDNEKKTWGEEAVMARAEARAKEFGKSLAQLLGEAGLSMGHDTLRRKQKSRNIATWEKVADALGWDLPRLLGISYTTNYDLLLEAYLAADRVIRRLPSAANTAETLVWVQCSVYEALAKYQRAGKPIDAAVISHYEEILVAGLQGKPPPGVATKAE